MKIFGRKIENCENTHLRSFWENIAINECVIDGDIYDKISDMKL